jgi:phosphate transport system substrate-binding protein
MTQVAMSRPRRPGVAAALAVLLGGLLTVPSAPAAGPRSRVTVVGSSTVFPFGAAVAESFGRMGRWKTPMVESIGTGAGFNLFCSGSGIDTPDINEASRPITDSESALCEKNGVHGILGVQIGFEGIVIASGKRYPPFDLTSEQLYRAIAKTVAVNAHVIPNPYRRWVDIDPSLPNRAISIFGPAPNHGTRDAFVALILVPACTRLPAVRALSQEDQTKLCQTLREDGVWNDIAGDYRVLLDKLGKNPDAVGVLPFSYLEQNGNMIQAARLDGVAPTPDSIFAFRYRAARPLFIYIKTSHVAAVPGLAEFVQEFVSEKAAGKDGYLIDKGMVALPPAWLAGEREKVTKRIGPRR